MPCGKDLPTLGSGTTERNGASPNREDGAALTMEELKIRQLVSVLVKNAL